MILQKTLGLQVWISRKSYKNPNISIVLILDATKMMTRSVVSHPSVKIKREINADGELHANILLICFLLWSTSGVVTPKQTEML